MLTIFSCLIVLNIRISLNTLLASTISSTAFNFFIATLVFVYMSIANNTVPYEPAPNSFYP